MTGLHHSLAELYPIPARYRQADVGRGEAAQLLGCDDATLTSLVGAGLPATGEPGRERFDSRDLFNLGLYAGTGSVVQQVFCFALRWLRTPTPALLEPRTSMFSTQIRCAAPDGCGPRPSCVLARPQPDRYGGESAGLDTDPDAVVDGATVAAAAPTLRLAATLRSRGELVPLRSTAARAAMREFAGAGLRWVKLPPVLGADVQLMLAQRIASCASASQHIAGLCRRAGLPATTRSGWIAGLEMTHAWVEIVDEDGLTKVLDPIVALFAAMVPQANPVLSDPELGVRTNRLIPSGYPAVEPLARHTCGGAAACADVTTRIVPAQRAEELTWCTSVSVG